MSFVGEVAVTRVQSPVRRHGSRRRRCFPAT